MTSLSRRGRAAGVAVLVVAFAGGAAACGGPPGDRQPAQPRAAAPRNLDQTVYVTGHCSFTGSNSLVPEAPGGAPGRAMGPDLTEGPHGGAIPDGFTPVSVFGCGSAEEDTAGAGIWTLATQSTAVGDLDDLVSAYRMPAPAPPQPTGVATACSAVADLDPEIAFVDAHGTAIWPEAPRDPVCHHVSTRVTKALAALHWTVTRAERVTPTSRAAAPSAS